MNLAYFAAKKEIEEKVKEEEFLSQNKNPSYLAGHSVGLISASVVAEAISFAKALKIVEERGILMEKACQINPGRMIAVLNYKKEGIEKLINDYELGGNFNSKNQIVLSGPSNDIEKIIEIINREKLGKIIPLKTEGAFHSKCMKLAEAPFAEFLEKIPFSNPKIPIVANSQVKIINKAQDLKRELVEHLSKPVRWVEGMELLYFLGVRRFIEIGEGEVLTKIVQNSFDKKEVEAISLSSLISFYLDKIIE